ncbi:SUKH-4 family immunity protein [Streptomyces sp. UH6]|nr:SUKH-4 family immunity protein [Streptomyces sp. UH6]
MGMPKQHVAVLADVGIPEEAAPFLAFDNPQLPCPLESWAFSEVPVEDADRFVVIGSDGSDNPVMLDRTRPGFVLLIDRERGTGAHVFNTGIPRFLSSLLAFRDYVDLRNSSSSPMAALQTLTKRLEEIDSEAWDMGSLWRAEIEAQAGLLYGRTADVLVSTFKFFPGWAV